MLNDYKIGEIYWANVKYEDAETRKIRPVLVLNSEEIIIIALKLTSQHKRAWDNGDYELRDWEYSGLSKPTVVRTRHLVSLEQEHMREKIGEISDYDWQEIMKLTDKK